MGLERQAAWIQHMILAAAWRHGLTDWGVKQRPGDMAGASSGTGKGRWRQHGLFGSNLVIHHKFRNQDLDKSVFSSRLSSKGVTPRAESRPREAKAKVVGRGSVGRLGLS